MSIKHTPPRDQQPAGKAKHGDIAALDCKDNRDTPSWSRSRIERRDWRGEGVVGHYHTD